MAFRRITRGIRELRRSSRGSVSVMIVFMCVALYTMLMFLNLVGIFDKSQSTFVLGLSYAGIFRHFWLYQLLTAPLLHLSLLHLAFNMLTLWMLGPDIERRLGRSTYLVFSVVCALSGSAGFLLFDQGTGYIMGGYSSVIFGILVAQAVYYPDRLIYIYAFFPVKMKYAALILAAVEVSLSFEPNGSWTAHSAHFFGAAAGWVFLQINGRIPARGVIDQPICRKEHRAVGVFPRKKPQKVGTISTPIAFGAVRCGADGGCTDTGFLTLIVLNGTSSGRRFAVRDKPLIIGRGAHCDVVLSDDQRVSRTHAELVPSDRGACTIVDAGSRNGVYVNGERTSRALLRPGDKICLGDTETMILAGEGR